jgi:crossover junction endodeoxyribonuclease RuvC
MIAGIDPGKTGAIAMLYDDGTLYIEDMPTFGKFINGGVIAGILRDFPADHIFIESSNSFGMGRQSAYNFGQGVGVLKGVMAALDIPYSIVSPARWKNDLGLNRDKSAARAAATRLFPRYADKFKRKKDDGRAEAALIAHWGMKKEGKDNEQH